MLITAVGSIHTACQPVLHELPYSCSSPSRDTGIQEGINRLAQNRKGVFTKEEGAALPTGWLAARISECVSNKAQEQKGIDGAAERGRRLHRRGHWGMSCACDSIEQEIQHYDAITRRGTSPAAVEAVRSRRMHA